jgi:2-polyprenyl-3-methyl-5-hydroxy-6-metoxy-1,4-benzoquinol methylase
MTNWLNYWSKKNIWQSSSLWKINSKIYYNKSKKYINYKDKNVLDIGSGSGELIDIIKYEAKKIFATDISSNFIKILKKKYKFDKKITVKRLDKNFNIKNFKIKFDTIICNSVTQYFKNDHEIIKMIDKVKKISKKNALFLISDIHSVKKKKILHIFFSLIDGFFMENFILLYKAFNNNNYKKYRALEKNLNLLKINYKQFKKKLDERKYNYKFINKRLTTNYNTFHLLFKF